ncbi:MAG: cell wall-binding repeat-containing protein [Oscillospiraceae bacterium]|jgi:putative cell wall-binding protein|nr:cell wall-binding repeat-containing protein [Oscillospiraceae bacterium]
MIRKIISLAVAAMLLLSVITVFPALAAEKPTITVSEERATPMDNVAVTLDISNNADISGLILELSYDTTKLQLKSVEDGVVFDEGNFTPGPLQPPINLPYRLVWNDSFGSTQKNGTLVTLNFIVLADAVLGLTPITIEVKQTIDADLNLNKVVFEVENGSITIANKGTEHENAPDIYNYFGSNRVETAAEIAVAGWIDTYAPTAFLASGNIFADALSGGPLVYANNAPLLLTMNTANLLEEFVTDAFEELQVENVVILGGSSSVSDEIKEQIRSLGIKVRRISGINRYETAAKVAEELYERKPFTSIFLADGTNFPDALSATPPAALLGLPILFTPAAGRSDVNTYTTDFLKSKPLIKNVAIMGGDSSVGEPLIAKLKSSYGIAEVERVAGGDRYETSTAIYARFKPLFTSKTLTVTTGAVFPDALAGGVFAAKLTAPILLMRNRYTQEIYDIVVEMNPREIYKFGGEQYLNIQTLKDNTPYIYND